MVTVRSPCCRGWRIVLCEVDWCTLIMSFEFNRSIRFQKSLVLAPDRQSDCKCCKMFTFPCPTSWQPEQLALVGTTKLCHCQPTYTPTVECNNEKWHRQCIYRPYMDAPTIQNNTNVSSVQWRRTHSIVTTMSHVTPELELAQQVCLSS